MIIRPEGCICIEFRDTGGFRIADLTCPVHGVGGTDPGDGYWDTRPAGGAPQQGEKAKPVMKDCPGCGYPLPYHEAKCQYRGLDERQIMKAMRP